MIPVSSKLDSSQENPAPVAVVAVEKALERYGSPVYVRKQIVHNKHVVSELVALAISLGVMSAAILAHPAILDWLTTGAPTPTPTPTP